MTEMIMYKDKEFLIHGSRGKGLFSPLMHGLHPARRITCVSGGGFTSRYEIRDDRLVLDYLSVNLDSPAPSLFGVQPKSYKKELIASEPLPRPEPPSTKEVVDSDYTSTNIKVLSFRSEHDAYYENLNHPVSFSGGLLLVRDYIKDVMRFTRGWQHPMRFSEVHELIFKEGELVAEKDHSRRMELYRKEGYEDADVERWVAWYADWPIEKYLRTRQLRCIDKIEKE